MVPGKDSVRRSGAARDRLLRVAQYQAWMKVADDGDEQLARAKRNVAFVDSLSIGPSVRRTDGDIARLQKLLDIYRARLSGQSFTVGGLPDEESGLLHDAITLANGVLAHESSAIEAGIADGLFSAIVAIGPSAEISAMDDLARVVVALQEQYSRAERDLAGAAAQVLISTALGVTNLLLSPVSILTHSGMALLTAISDEILGPTGLEPRSASSASLSAFFGAMSDYEKLTSRVQTVPSGAGGVFTVTGLIFDIAELRGAYRESARLQELMSKAEALQSEVSARLDALMPGLERLAQLRQQWALRIQDDLANAEMARRELADILSKSNLE